MRMEIFIIDCAGDSHPVAVNNGEIAATLPLTLKKKNFGLVPSSNNTAYLARKMTTHYLTKIARFYVFFWGSISLVAQLRIVAEGAAVRNRTAGRLDKNAYFPETPAEYQSVEIPSLEGGEYSVALAEATRCAIRLIPTALITTPYNPSDASLSGT
jgi:hypothetical protein